MKKVLVFLFLLFSPMIAFSQCQLSDSKFYGINETALLDIQSKQNGNNFYCWEIDYLIKTNQSSMPFSNYKNLLKSEVNLLFPNNSKNVSNLRKYGSIFDFEKLDLLKKQYNIDSDNIDKIIEEASPKVLKFYPFISMNQKIINQNAIEPSKKICLSESDFSKLTSPFSKLSQVRMWNSSTGNFLNIFGTKLANINKIINEKSAEIRIGFEKGTISWNSKNCRVLAVENTWAKGFTDISQVLFFALFENAGAFLDRAFDDLASLGQGLLGILLTLWIVIYILKRFWEVDKGGFSGKDFVSDIWKLMIFASLYLIILIGFSPKELVDTFIVPILDIGAYYGRIVFEASFGHGLPTPDASFFIDKIGSDTTISGLVAPLYAFVSAFNETSLLPFSIAEMLITYGWEHVLLPQIIIGLGVLILFGLVWIKIFIILLECVLDLIIVMMLYPLLALAYVFPLTRPHAKIGIEMIMTVGTTLIFYPILIVFNSRLMMAFLTRSDPNTNQTVESLLKSGDKEGLVRAFDLSFSMVIEGFFIGVLMLYVIKIADELIKEFGRVKEKSAEVEGAVKDYQKHWKNVKKAFTKEKPKAEE